MKSVESIKIIKSSILMDDYCVISKPTKKDK